MKRKRSFLISLFILLGAALVVVIILTTEPTAVRETATRETAMLVNVIAVDRDNYRPVIVSTGTVRAASEIALSPRVSGEVMNRSVIFDPGRTVIKGDVLLQIDPADYKNALQLRRSELQQSMANFEIEKGRQEVARRDYEQSGREMPEEQRDLVLRIPQLRTAESEVEAARASVRQAELDLQRTTIRAPFDAQVLSRNVDVGSQVSPGELIANLVGTDHYWVETTVPQSKIKWLNFSGEISGQESNVKIRNRNAWDDESFRSGSLYRMIGSLEERTRLVRVLITVNDPLGANSDSADVPALLIGSFVEADIEGKELPDVVKLSRDYVRKNKTVWVMSQDTLDIRNVEIVLTDAEHAYIRDGLDDNDKVVTTNLATVVEGAPLRLSEEGIEINP